MSWNLLGVFGNGGLCARGNPRRAEPSVLRFEFSGSLLNLIENGPLNDRGAVGLSENNLPHLQNIAS